MHNWVNDEQLMIAYCNGGTRPVTFKIKRIDIPKTEDENNGLQCIILRIRLIMPIQTNQQTILSQQVKFFRLVMEFCYLHPMSMTSLV